MSLYLFFKVIYSIFIIIFFSLCTSVGLFSGRVCKGEDWKMVLLQWLTLLKLMKNPRSFPFSQFLNDVLQNRLA